MAIDMAHSSFALSNRLKMGTPKKPLDVVTAAQTSLDLAALTLALPDCTGGAAGAHGGGGGGGGGAKPPPAPGGEAARPTARPPQQV